MAGARQLPSRRRTEPRRVPPDPPKPALPTPFTHPTPHMDATYADGRARDWTSYYDGDYDRVAYIGRDAMPDLLARFIERVGRPDSFASVGCGPAVAEFELAERYPGTDFHCYDVAERVVADNRALAADRNLDNLSFAVDALPDLDVDREFDLVYCVATLYFVRDAERAVRALYDRVRPGGHLAFNYPNRHTRRTFDREFDGDRRDLFRHVLDGDNLLSRDRVRDLLDADPCDYWTAVDAADRAFVGPDTPFVYVEK